MEYEKLQIVLDLYKAGHIDFAQAKILLAEMVHKTPLQEVKPITFGEWPWKQFDKPCPPYVIGL